MASNTGQRDLMVVTRVLCDDKSAKRTSFVANRTPFKLFLYAFQRQKNKLSFGKRPNKRDWAEACFAGTHCRRSGDPRFLCWSSIAGVVATGVGGNVVGQKCIRVKIKVKGKKRKGLNL